MNNSGRFFVGKLMAKENKVVVLVTGASGFLGNRICHALTRQESYRVKALVRRSSDVSDLPPGTELAYGDITDPTSLIDSFHECHAVIHCAAAVSPWLPDSSKFIRVNVDGFKNVIKAVQNKSSIERLVYVSSFFALGPSNGKVADETQMHPGHSFCTEYEKSKVTADLIALEEAKKGLPVVITYPGVIYGPGKATEGNSLLSLIVERCNGRLPGYLGPGNDRISLCHVDDVAEGCIRALERGRKGERYLLTGENASLNDVLDIVDSIIGRKPAWFQTPVWLLNTIGWMSVFRAKVTGATPLISYPMVNVIKKQWTYSHEKAQQELGYHSRPLKQGITEFMSWMNSRGLIRMTSEISKSCAAA